MPKPSDQAQERLRAVETLLLWEGWVSRGRLLELFSVHATVASNTLSEYRQRFPNACQPELGNKGYLATPSIQPELTSGEFVEYERLIGAKAGIEIGPGVAFASADAMSPTFDHRIFSRIHMAIARAGALSIEYRSMRNPKRHRRLIRPHALIQAGPRWHVRAFCADTETYRDFNVGRISRAITAAEAALPGGEGDQEWNATVKIELVPHVDLSPDQALVVRQEYMGGAAVLAFNVRISMAKYVIQAYRAAMDHKREGVPEHLLMVLDPEKLAQGVGWSASHSCQEAKS